MAQKIRLISIIIIYFGVVLVLFYTLFPFDFSFEETFASLDVYFFLLGCGISNTEDIILNVLLFLPIGFGISGYQMQKKGAAAGLSIIGVVFLVSLGLSYSIEILQVFQPSRSPALADVLSNSAGGLIGYIFYRWFFLSSFLLAFVASIPFQLQTNLSNWHETFPLLLGNERTANRPWDGYISQLYIADRVISKEEIAQFFSGKAPFDSMEDSLLASYQLSGAGSYHDQTGLLADLVWIGEPNHVKKNEKDGVLLGSRHWLKSALPATSLTQRTMDSSQFTLIVTVATNKTHQTGPARIVSLSGDTSHRNFTLGQEENHLIFRLRTPFIGENGYPECIVEDVFSTTDPRNLIISYNGSVLQIYVDKASNPYTFEFSPGAVAYSYLFPIKPSFLTGYKIIWYAIIFIPLGILVSIKIKKPITPISVSWIVLPAFALETILVIVSGRDFILRNILISLVFAVGPLVLLGMVRREN